MEINESQRVSSGGLAGRRENHSEAVKKGTRHRVIIHEPQGGNRK